MGNISSLLNSASGDKAAITLYHGTIEVFEKPVFGVGKSDNDYGSGFYTTPIYDRAVDWGCNKNEFPAYVNTYELNLSGLKIIDLDDYGPLTWIATVAYHRDIHPPLSSKISENFCSAYMVNLDGYDIVKGLRADDSYADVVLEFMNNSFSAFEVERMFTEGDLGIQYFIRSRKAFDSIKFICRDTIPSGTGNNYEMNARRKNMSKMSNRFETIMSTDFNVPFPTMRDALQKKLKWNKEGRYYET